MTECLVVHAFVPPSTVRFAPVMYEDSGPATNDTSAATSSTRSVAIERCGGFLRRRPLAGSGIQIRVDRPG